MNSDFNFALFNNKEIKPALRQVEDLKSSNLLKTYPKGGLILESWVKFPKKCAKSV